MKEAIRNAGKIPDVVYHRGDVGKEPMIVVFGGDASSLAKLIVETAREIVTS